MIKDYATQDFIKRNNNQSYRPKTLDSEVSSVYSMFSENRYVRGFAAGAALLGAVLSLGAGNAYAQSSTASPASTPAARVERGRWDRLWDSFTGSGTSEEAAANAQVEKLKQLTEYEKKLKTSGRNASDIVQTMFALDELGVYDYDMRTNTLTSTIDTNFQADSAKKLANRIFETYVKPYYDSLNRSSAEPQTGSATASDTTTSSAAASGTTTRAALLPTPVALPAAQVGTGAAAGAVEAPTQPVANYSALETRLDETPVSKKYKIDFRVDSDGKVYVKGDSRADAYNALRSVFNNLPANGWDTIFGKKNPTTETLIGTYDGKNFTPVSGGTQTAGTSSTELPNGNGHRNGRITNATPHGISDYFKISSAFNQDKAITPVKNGEYILGATQAINDETQRNAILDAIWGKGRSASEGTLESVVYQGIRNKDGTEHLTDRGVYTFTFQKDGKRVTRIKAIGSRKNSFPKEYGMSGSIPTPTLETAVTSETTPTVPPAETPTQPQPAAAPEISPSTLLSTYTACRTAYGIQGKRGMMKDGKIDITDDGDLAHIDTFLTNYTSFNETYNKSDDGVKGKWKNQKTYLDGLRDIINRAMNPTTPAPATPEPAIDAGAQRIISEVGDRIRNQEQSNISSTLNSTVDNFFAHHNGRRVDSVGVLKAVYKAMGTSAADEIKKENYTQLEAAIRAAIPIMERSRHDDMVTDAAQLTSMLEGGLNKNEAAQAMRIFRDYQWNANDRAVRNQWIRRAKWAAIAAGAYHFLKPGTDPIPNIPTSGGQTGGNNVFTWR